MTLQTKNLGIVQAIFVGTIPPTNTNMLWRDTSSSPHTFKSFDNLTSSWVELSNNLANTDLVQTQIQRSYTVFEDGLLKFVTESANNTTVIQFGENSNERFSNINMHSQTFDKTVAVFDAENDSYGYVERVNPNEYDIQRRTDISDSLTKTNRIYLTPESSLIEFSTGGKFEARLTQTIIEHRVGHSGGRLSLSETGNTFEDFNSTKRGIQYIGDYSADFTDRSLVDKAFAEKTNRNYIDIANFISGYTLVANDAGSVITNSGVNVRSLNIPSGLALPNNIVFVKGRVSITPASGVVVELPDGTTITNSAQFACLANTQYVLHRKEFGGDEWILLALGKSENIYTNNGTTGSNRTVTITDVLNFNGGKVALNSTTAGFLMPRVTTLQMNGIATPSTNELVFNTDLNGIYRYNGGSWVALSSGYGIIGVYSGTGNGTPVFFADLQSALETCKASGGYFTVKLYSNITITSAIQIEYTGSGVGNAYQFRQLTIDFNGFSVTNAQANNSHGFNVRLSNSISIYQQLNFINGTVNRTNGTGTHYALNVSTEQFGTIQMSKMIWYCQNNISAYFLNQVLTGFERYCDFGESLFISDVEAIRIQTSTIRFTNFRAISRGASLALACVGGIVDNFTAENTANGNAIFAGNNSNVSNFKVFSNTGIGLDLVLGVASDFTVKSTSGIAVNVGTNTQNYVNNFYAETGNNRALNVTVGGFISNGVCVNDSAENTVVCVNFESVNNVEGINKGSGTGLQFSLTDVRLAEATKCKGISFLGVGAFCNNTNPSATLTIDDCFISSDWNNSNGHALFLGTNNGNIKITKSHFKVRNSSSNCLHAPSAVTVNSCYCAHNGVATTPINANVTIVLSGIIS